MMERLTHRSAICRLVAERLERRDMMTVIMTPQEQLMIELVNRTRANPEVEAARYGIDLNFEIDEEVELTAEPRQPLAPHQALVDAAGLHSEDMLARDFFGHDTPEGITPSDRAMAAGYPTGAGENIAWRGDRRGVDRNQEVYSQHEGLFRSPGHRVNMLRDSWREMGAGVRFGNFRQLEDGLLFDFPSIMVGTLFGNRRGNYFITGVAINDSIAFNGFYEIGEGLGDVSIAATSVATGEVFTDVTGPTGGYGVQVPSGTYTVTATGGGLPEPITVSGVQVDDQNVKVDFTWPFMPTSDISGNVFQDNNGNGQRDAGEPHAIGHTVFLDLDRNGDLDANDPRVQTRQDGTFIFEDFLPGEYVILQEVPSGWTQTEPESALIATLVPNRNVVGALFGAQPGNAPPVSVDDNAEAFSAVDVLIDVLANDSDSDGSLDPASIRIETDPANGTAELDAETGRIRYTSLPGFGVDSFEYTVADLLGKRSERATVRVNVQERPVWRNQSAPFDVNGDGVIVSIDALVIIRELNRSGGGSLLSRAKAVAGPPYYDVNGDESLTSLDALQVLRYLHRQRVQGGEASGEPETLPEPKMAASAVDQLLASSPGIAAALLADETD